ncbi:MAG TPA: hypothetical protein VGN86_03440 [Pyrinomonadaceae bacterium]|jgi:hypothetical protein|nr:hypothetical protein [Pyrinomonadaceae bacterium]
MKRIKSILGIALLSLAVSSTAFAGNISGSPAPDSSSSYLGNISGYLGNISGYLGNISGYLGNISGRLGNISG